jgi:ATP-dependent Lon protease
MPVINPENYATGYGFMSDYLAEIFAEIRRRNYLTHMSAQVSFPGMNQRNQDAVKKTAAGMLKLLYPHVSAGDVPRSVMELVLNFAVEMRKRIIVQMSVMKPAEFQDVSFDCRLTNGV